MQKILCVHLNQKIEKVYSFEASHKDLVTFAQRAGIPQAHHINIQATFFPATKIQQNHITVLIDASLKLSADVSTNPSFLFEKKLSLFLCTSPTNGSRDTEHKEYIHVNNDTIDVGEIAFQHIIMDIPSHSFNEDSAASKNPEPTHMPFKHLDKVLNSK